VFCDEGIFNPYNSADDENPANGAYGADGVDPVNGADGANPEDGALAQPLRPLSLSVKGASLPLFIEPVTSFFLYCRRRYSVSQLTSQSSTCKLTCQSLSMFAMSIDMQIFVNVSANQLTI